MPAPPRLTPHALAASRRRYARRCGAAAADAVAPRIAHCVDGPPARHALPHRLGIRRYSPPVALRRRNPRTRQRVDYCRGAACLATPFSSRAAGHKRRCLVDWRRRNTRVAGRSPQAALTWRCRLHARVSREPAIAPRRTLGPRAAARRMALRRAWARACRRAHLRFVPSESRRRDRGRKRVRRRFGTACRVPRCNVAAGLADVVTRCWSWYDRWPWPRWLDRQSRAADRACAVPCRLSPRAELPSRAPTPALVCYLARVAGVTQYRFDRVSGDVRMSARSGFTPSIVHTFQIAQCLLK